MILDTSAVVALMLKEPGWEIQFRKLVSAPRAGIGSPTTAETGIVLRARIGSVGPSLLERFLQEFGIETIPFGDLHWRKAIEAYSRFGKGQHPAGLNFGDCMAYAVAKVADEPLLCRGDDFSKTDIPLA